MKLSSILFKKCQRSIKSSWKQFLAIIGIASIAITLFLGLSANADSLKNRVDKYYKQSHVSDIYLTVNKYDDEDRNNVEKIVDEFGGGTISLRTYMPSYLEDTTAAACIYDYFPTTNIPLIKSGGFDDDNNYFLIDESLSKKKEFKTQINVGDEINVSFSTSYFTNLFPIEIEKLNVFLKPGGHNFFQDDFVKIKMNVTGTMDFCENIQNGAYSLTNFCISKDYIFTKVKELISSNFNENFTSLAFSYFSNVNITNQFLIKLNNQKKVEECLKQIQIYFQGNNRLYSSSNLENETFNVIIQSDIDQARQLTLVFPLFFFFVAVLVILSTISQLIIKERLEIGTLKAIGVPASSIYKYYMSLMLVLVGIGLLLGVIIGPILIPFIMNIKYSILYTLPSLTYVFPFKEFLFTSLLLEGFTALCVYFASKNEIKLTPSESMRPKKIKSLHSHKNKIKHRVSANWLSMKMAFRNIKLNPLKSLMVVIGVMGCTSLLVAGFGIDNTLDYSIKHDMDMFYNADIMFTYNSNSQSLKDKLLAYEEVEEVDEMRNVSITATGKKNIETNLFVLEHNHNLTKINLYEDGIVISQKVANDGNYKIGDTITFQVLNKTYSGTIKHILNTFVRHGLFIDGESARYDGLLNIISTSFVKIKEGYNAKESGEKIKQSLNEISLYTTRDDMFKTINNTISSISYMTLTVKVFAILLAIVVLYNLAYLNFKERIREMATLKVLGFKQSNIAKSLIYETMILVLIGTIFGLFLGFPVEFIVLYVNRNALVEFLYTCYKSTYFFSFLLSFLTGLIINFVLSLYIKKVKMVESLKSVE